MSASPDDPAGSHLSSSFIDLMSSLAVIFILLTVVYLREIGLRGRVNREQVRQSLASVLSKEGLPIRPDEKEPTQLNVVIGENSLRFPLNRSELSSDARQFLNRFAPPFLKTLCFGPRSIAVKSLLIEGHTDRSGEGVGPGVTRNILLSQRRSLSVLEALLDSVNGQDALRECLLKLASATGRGSRNPVMVNGQYNSDLSRRVELKINVSSTEKDPSS